MKNIGIISLVLIIFLIVGISLYLMIPKTNANKAQQTQGVIGLGMLMIGGIGLVTLILSNIVFTL